MPNTLSLLRLLFDFGMLVLIWLVQVIIYPSFRYYSKRNLKRWHKKYMQVSAILIAPQMLGQLIITVLQCYDDQNSYTTMSLIILIILWAHTFYQFVPLHNAIKTAEKTSEITLKLVNYNWWRTILWSMLFVYSYITLVVSG
ncbi:hypothetical protein [Flavimarina sp. Hel_I_48]|uniref:hypothetical protein n=1 Tax=Flavimarina sp. Hel_I_48 TaxID=1392488 RepID=UPI0004DF5A89|nr:hypothetical protein [Flavimarina sp. Hel_I_48]